MKFRIAVSELSNAISIVQRAISSRNTQEVLNGVYIAANQSSLNIIGYNSTMGIEAVVEASVMTEGATVLKSRLFGDIIRKLDQNEDVEISLKGNNLVNIKSGKTSFNIGAMDARQYPSLPVADDISSPIILPQSELSRMIRQTIFSLNRGRHLSDTVGINFMIENNIIELTGCSELMIAISRYQSDRDHREHNFTVPVKTIEEVGKIFDNPDEDIKIYKGNKIIRFDSNNIKIVSPLVSNEPIVEQKNMIFSRPSISEFNCGTRVFLEAAERVTVLNNSQQRSGSINLSHEDRDVLRVHCTTDNNYAEELLDVKFTGGKNFEIKFAPKIFIEPFKVAGCDMLTFKVCGEKGPFLIEPKDGNEFNYLILPLVHAN